MNIMYMLDAVNYYCAFSIFVTMKSRAILIMILWSIVIGLKSKWICGWSIKCMLSIMFTEEMYQFKDV